MTDERQLGEFGTHYLRHLLATIAYRSSRALGDAPKGYAELNLGSGVRTPREIVAHMTGVLGYVLAKVTGTERQRYPMEDWDAEVKRFYWILNRIDEALAVGANCGSAEADKLIQGPLADTLTHIGQLSTMRRIAGAPIPGENFILADIRIGRVGIDQGDPAVRE